MGKRKLLNDPIYGLINYPHELIYEVIGHPMFQRLRRISQMGLTSYVYPGAVHNRFHHALGATHLMNRALDTLRSKGVEISEDEHEAACLAILLHDVGHGPFSHTLEKSFLSIHHEDLSLAIMHFLNREFEGRLALCIKIFSNEYTRSFFYQLVSGQLDMDRMDYLTRDSYFTGVAEGVIGYDRIIAMLNVVDGQLVVEEKGIHSVEKFIVARQIMYWQVYLHKTSLAAEKMLISFLRRLKDVYHDGGNVTLTDPIEYFLKNQPDKSELEANPEVVLLKFANIDDIDIWSLLKNQRNSEDQILSALARRILDRDLFKIKLDPAPISSDFEAKTRQNCVDHLKVNEQLLSYIVLNGTETNQAYTTTKDEILILTKDGVLLPFSSMSRNLIDTSLNVRYFLCFPEI